MTIDYLLYIDCLNICMQFMATKGMAYALFSDINNTSRNIRIKARVVRIWEFANISNPDDVYSLEFLMLDEKVLLKLLKS